MATFEMFTRPGRTPTEYVRIPVGRDEVFRPATEEDKKTYADEYAAFLAASRPAPSAPVPVPAPVAPEPVAKESHSVHEATETHSHKKFRGK